MKTSLNTIVHNEQGKFLLQMRDGTPGICDPLMRNFFGGGLDGERPLEVARRELVEELGVAADLSEFELVSTMEYDGKLVHIVRLLRLLGWADITVGEGAGAGNFSREEAGHIDITDQTRQIIARFL